MKNAAYRRTSCQAGSIGVAIAGALFAPGASAQSPSASGTGATDDTVLEEVVVTAQFHRENLQETPLAITAISGEALEARGATNLADVASQAPNVILQQNAAGAGNSMRAQIRGVGQGDLDPAVDPGVGIYIDDVYFATLTGSDFALLDLDRVEILRGPQGTLSGMNSLGGSVKLYSQKATGDGKGYVEGTYGSLDRVQLRASGDFSLIPDQLFLRLSGVSRHNSGYVTMLDYACTHPTDPYVISGAYPRGNFSSDCKTGTEGGTSYSALRASLRWLPSDAVEVNWITDATRDNSETTATTLLDTPASIFSGNGTVPWMGAPYDQRFLPPSPYISYANFLDPGVTYAPVDTAGTAGARLGAFYATPNNTLNAYGSSLTIDWKLADDLSVKSISAYRHYISQFGDDNSASPVPLVLEEARFTHRQASQELRLNGAAWGSLLSYTLGGIYFDYTTYYAAREDDPFLAAFYGGPATPTFDFLQNDPTHTKTSAAFFNGGWHFTDQLTLNTGVRYTHENKSYTYHRLNIDGATPYLVLSNPADPLNGKVGNFTGSHTDYRLDLDYQWTSTLMTYAEYSTGFKGGGVTPRPYYPEQVIGFGPETLKSYELGLKSEWFDHSLRANFATFYQQYDNYQAFATPATCVDVNGNPLPPQYANPCGEYRNVADATGKGVEAEVDYLLGGLSINSSVSYLAQHFTDSKTTSVTAGQVPPGIGKVRASAGAQYKLGLGDNGTLTPRLDLTYTPRFCGDLTCDSNVDSPAYTLLNARLSYDSSDRKWGVALEVTNLTDKLYYLSRVNTGAGYLDGQIAAPREWAISLRRDF